jgi:hypothetical protein
MNLFPCIVYGLAEMTPCVHKIPQLATVTFSGTVFVTDSPTFSMTDGFKNVVVLPLSIKATSLTSSIGTNSGNVFALEQTPDRA